jgi:hypothetical protein
MSGEGGGIGGVDPGGDSVARGRSLAHKAIEQRRQFDAARVAMQRRLRLAPIGAAAAGPTIEATTTEEHVLQDDFLNVVGSATGGYTEVEVTRDADAGMRFYSAPGVGGSGATFGTATIDFGAFPGSNEASVAVAGQASILATSKVDVFVMADDTSGSHTANDHRYAQLLLGFTATTPAVGVGFTIHARCLDKMQGTFAVRWRWS